MSNVTADRPAAAPAALSDLELLRAYEPVLAFTQGEMFFPMRVEGYIERCSLTARTDSKHQRVVAPTGGLSAHTLADFGTKEAQQQLSLRFVDEPMGGADYQHWHARRPEFHAMGRLSRVGLIGRFPDALFRLTFFLRGRVPGGTTASAQVQYADIQAEDPSFTYYGRVVRGEDYVVLNYQFFYAMNDWRSSFFGVNDHEADWEQIFVYLVATPDGALEPAWVAYASHDFHGADLRRRWDDPTLTLAGTHPVVYVGAGSHASYFEQGEYVIAVGLKLLGPVSDVTSFLRRFWRQTLRQGTPGSDTGRLEEALKVPFVDYARGDGISVGPGQPHEWSPAVIDESVDWVGYRGLWGLDTRDVFAGELAPAGPRYNRDGFVRQSWYDPLGWAELDREPAPAQAQGELAHHIDTLKLERYEITNRTTVIRDELPRLTLSLQAMTATGATKGLRDERARQIEALEAELRQLARRQEELRVELAACEAFAPQVQKGYRGGPKDHLRHERSPEPEQTFHEGRIAEVWAAASIGLLLVMAAVLLAAGAPWFTALLILIGGAILVDSILRGSVLTLLLNTTVTLGIIAAIVLLYEFFWLFVFAGLAAAGLLILANNLREVRR